MTTIESNPIIIAIKNNEFEKAVDMIAQSLHPLPEFPTDVSGGPKYKLVIHGGAGTLTRGMMTPDKEKDYRSTLMVSLLAGQYILHTGGSALDAVCNAVKVMEDSPLFNAGRGAVFTHDGDIELDACVMTGHDRRAGSVAQLKTIRNPILGARAVMEQSPHVMLAAHGAEEFCKSVGLQAENPEYFRTQFRRSQLDVVRDNEGAVLDHDAQYRLAIVTHRRDSRPDEPDRAVVVHDDAELSQTKAMADALADHPDVGAVEVIVPDADEYHKDSDEDADSKGPSGAEVGAAMALHDRKYGTVGAVAVDAQGHVAAATSTGGMTNKRWGRVGDSPVVGAGTYADDTVAVSCTGTGEVFLRKVAAYDVSARMRYCSYGAEDIEKEKTREDKVTQAGPLNTAACAVSDVLREINILGGSGGIIVVCPNGDHALAFTTEGMYRGVVGSDTPIQTGVYEDE